MKRKRLEKIDCAYIERYGGGNSRTIDSTTAFSFFFFSLNTTSNYSNDRHEILKEEHGEKLARLQSKGNESKTLDSSHGSSSRN